jgi:hypothetical protein
MKQINCHVALYSETEIHTQRRQEATHHVADSTTKYRKPFQAPSQRNSQKVTSESIGRNKSLKRPRDTGLAMDANAFHEVIQPVGIEERVR